MFLINVKNTSFFLFVCFLIFLFLIQWRFHKGRNWLTLTVNYWLCLQHLEYFLAHRGDSVNICWNVNDLKFPMFYRLRQKKPGERGSSKYLRMQTWQSSIRKSIKITWAEFVVWVGVCMGKSEGEVYKQSMTYAKAQEERKANCFFKNCRLP